MSSDERLALLTDGMMDVPEVCQFTRLSRSEIYAAMERGDLPFTKHGRRRLIPRKAVVALLEKNLVSVG
jgi:excisionase family DNA binding protein